MERTESARRLLVEGLESLELPAGAEPVERLLRLALLLEQWAGRINLTGHRGLEAIVRGLVLEAAALIAAIPSTSALADLGSGAGFPGLPAAILRPGCRLTLVDARLRRHHFQRAAVRELGLENARLLLGRAEALPPEPHPAVVAQAFARPEQALRWMQLWAEPSGLLLLPGSDPGPEIAEVEGVRFLERRAYRVPCGGPARTVWIGRRSCDIRSESP